MSGDNKQVPISVVFKQKLEKAAKWYENNMNMNSRII